MSLNPSCCQRINFKGVAAGHRSCNRYAAILVSGGQTSDVMRDPILYADVMQAMAACVFDRKRRWAGVAALAAACLGNRHILPRAIRAVLRVAWDLRAGLLAGHGVRKLTFFIHGFMDAQCLERDRVAACSFTVMTQEGPISMCLHNAKRDAFILRPSKTADGRWWDPIAGRFTDVMPDRAGRVVLTRHNSKGRAKQTVVS